MSLLVVSGMVMVRSLEALGVHSATGFGTGLCMKCLHARVMAFCSSGYSGLGSVILKSTDERGDVFTVHVDDVLTRRLFVSAESCAGVEPLVVADSVEQAHYVVDLTR